MVKFFAYQPGRTQTGDLTLVQRTVDAFAKERQTGLSEIEWSSSSLGVLLLADGQIVGVNILEANVCKKIPYEQLGAFWKGGRASVRSLQTSLETVRIVLATLEWAPPNQAFSLQEGEFQKYLETSKTHRHNGLFRMIWDDMEGYIFLLSGQPLPNESIADTLKDNLIGIQAHERLLASTQKPLTLEFYEAGLVSTAYQQTCFRFAFAQLLQGILNRYSRLVGADLMETLASTANQQMEKRQYHLTISQNQLSDKHIFPSAGVAMQAYRFLFKNIIDQIGEMVGAGLAHSMTFEAFKSMPSDKQQFLRESPLMIMIISPG